MDKPVVPMPDAVGNIESDIRIAIWNAAMSGGMGQDLSLAMIRRAMAEPCMARALQIAERVKALEEALERAADIVQEAIEQGYPAPTNKVDQCSHGRFSWEDCISCYDDLLMTKVAEIRALAPASGDGEAG